MSKPTIPKGTRDFSPDEMRRRNYIFDTIRKSFNLYGFEQIETPSFENLSTLEGKYGEEGDKLLFRILNSGNVLEDIRSTGENLKMNSLTEKGLRYDLTVPFARYVVMHQNEITFPFKRFQIQPVWRADRPQKGRYREFFQCDADVIGSNSLLNEVDLLSIIDDVFTSLKIKVSIKLNNRKILAGIAEIIGEPEKITDITIAIDKIDKIGTDKVIEELRIKGLSEKSISLLEPIFKIEGNNENKLSALKNILEKSATGIKGIEEIEIIIKNYSALQKKTSIDVQELSNALLEALGPENMSALEKMPEAEKESMRFSAERLYGTERSPKDDFLHMVRFMTRERLTRELADVTTHLRLAESRADLAEIERYLEESKLLTDRIAKLLKIV